MDNSFLSSVLSSGLTNQQQLDQINLQRQQALADQLRAEALQPAQGQMVSGHYVAPGIGNVISRLGSAYFGNQLQNKTAQTQLAQNQQLAALLRGSAPNASATPDSSSAATPTSETPSGTPTGSDMFGFPNLLRGSMINALGGSPAASAYWTSLTPTEANRTLAGQGVDPKVMGPLAVAEARKKGILELQPGTTALDLSNGAERYQPKLGEGQVYQGGQVSTAPGYTQSLGDITGAQEAAKAGQDLVTIQLPTGPVQMTRAQAVRLSQGNSSPASGDFRGDPTQITADISSISDPNERAAAMQAYKKQLGGIPLKSNASTEFDKTRATDAGKYFTGLANKVSNGNDLLMRLDESRQALKGFQAGGGAETRAKLAQLAQALPGVSPAMVNKIAGGDLASMQEFQKLAVQQAMETLKQTMATDNGQAGRMTQAEFLNFLKVNPNLSTDPNAIDKLFSFTEKVHQRNQDELHASDAYLQNGGDPTRWTAEWDNQLTSKRNAIKNAPIDLDTYLKAKGH